MRGGDRGRVSVGFLCGFDVFFLKRWINPLGGLVRSLRYVAFWLKVEGEDVALAGLESLKA
jgi:hypothetical protein